MAPAGDRTRNQHRSPVVADDVGIRRVRIALSSDSSYAGYRVRLRQVHLQQEVEMEHFEREHLAEVDRLKSRFFANISHEFRTPLTLILGPIQKWRALIDPSAPSHLQGNETAIRMTGIPEELHHDLSMAERNAHRLLRLINQLLDLSKLEAGAMKLRASRMNIVPLVKGIAYSFESSAGMRGIDLNVHVEQEEIEVYCDRDMVEKILSNLLSNAFKFTPDGGRVTVTVTELSAQNSRTQSAEVGPAKRDRRCGDLWSPTPASASHQINSTRSSTASTRSTLRKRVSMRDRASDLHL